MAAFDRSYPTSSVLLAFCAVDIRYVRDGQTDGRTKATLNAPFPAIDGTASDRLLYALHLSDPSKFTPTPK